MDKGRIVDIVTLGPQRRRRWMRRRLAALDRADRLDPDVGVSRSAPRRRPQRAGRPVVAGALFVVVLGTGGLAFTASEFADLVPWTADDVLGQAPEAPPGVGGYVFSSSQRGRPDQPVAYSPCDPLTVLLNDDAAPPGTEGMVEDAVEEVSSLTGLRIVVAGKTSQLPNAGGVRDLDAPALVAWTDPEQVPGLEGDVAGLGGSTAVEVPTVNRAWLRTGQVALDSPDLTEILARPGGEAQVYAIVLHELGHLVGLDHTEDSTQLMHAENRGVDSFQAGDRRGLALLGQGRCR